MKNIPRIFIEQNIKTNDIIPVARDTAHYLLHVMRTKSCLVFHSGDEFNANLSDDGKNLIIGDKTAHHDPSNDITLYIAPIKRMDDLVNMVTQMGVARIVPVITERTVAHHINWGRIKKIATEAAEQSNRNSIPEISEPIPFAKLDLKNMAFADERTAYSTKEKNKVPCNIKSILVGPEGGFSDSEFAVLDTAGAVSVSLGRTILRAELAAVIATEKIMK